MIQSSLEGQTTEQILWTRYFLAAIFIGIFLYDVGYALTSLKYLIKTRSITTLLLAGLAHFENLQKDPKRELLVALAGAEVNLAIAGVMYLGKSTSGIANVAALDFSSLSDYIFRTIRMTLYANVIKNREHCNWLIETE